jgi:chromosome partitioning protein
MSTIISVTSRKGGVGKTALATSLASILADQGASVLLVDMDPQSSAALALGVDPLAPGTANWLMGQHAQFQEVQPGLKLLAASPLLDQFREEDGHILKQRLAEAKEDFVVIDTAAGSAAISRCAVAMSDIVLVAAEPHPLALAAATTILDGLSSAKPRALILSRVDMNKSLHREIVAGASEAFPGTSVFAVRADSRMERALAEGKPASRLSNWSKAKVDIENVMEWLTNQEEA